MQARPTARQYAEVCVAISERFAEKAMEQPDGVLLL